jgi:hypothetical protein
MRLCGLSIKYYGIWSMIMSYTEVITNYNLLVTNYQQLWVTSHQENICNYKNV